MLKRTTQVKIMLLIVVVGLIGSMLIISCDYLPKQVALTQNDPVAQTPTKGEPPPTEDAESKSVEKPTSEPKTEPQKGTTTTSGQSVKLGVSPYTVPYGNTPKMIVSAYEYPDWERCGKLHCMEIVPNHNNRSVINGASYSSIARYSYGNELLIVATVNGEKLDISKAKVRWTIHEPSGYYGKGVRPSFIKAAGVPESDVQLSTDQVITAFGDGPVYVHIPQGVVGLRECTGDPICPIEIGKNQSWIIIYSPAPGLTNFLVNLVQPGNVNYPQVDYSVRWGNKIPDLEQCVDLKVNVTEAPANPDPHVFNSSVDQVLKWKIEVEDVSDYYINPTAPGILPILYPIIEYDLRFRRDPLQWDPKNWADVYNVTIDQTLDANAEYGRRLNWECKHNAPIPSAGPAYLYNQELKPGTATTFTGYTAFKAHQSLVPNSAWGDDHYYYAVQRSVDASLRYETCCKYGGNAWHNITDESISLEFEPGPDATISGLEVTWLSGGRVQLKNTGSAPVYEIHLQKSSGIKRGITPFLAAGAVKIVDEADGERIQKGDWIWYLVYSTNNTEPSSRAPVVARQKKVRVQ